MNEFLWSDIWNVSYIELRIWNQVSCDLRSCECNLSNWKVRTSTPLKSWLFQASIRNCLNCVHNCEDHSLLTFFCDSNDINSKFTWRKKEGMSELVFPLTSKINNVELNTIWIWPPCVKIHTHSTVWLAIWKSKSCCVNKSMGQAWFSRTSFSQ